MIHATSRQPSTLSREEYRLTERVVAQVEWPGGELCPRGDFVVTTVPRSLFATILERIDYLRAIPGPG